jgi:predicted DCC family thiol-disulfide oxidoreductase YuxK
LRYNAIVFECVVSNTGFPTPDDRPDADVVVYDGQCPFCRRQVERLIWWDCQKRLAYLSLDDDQVATRYPDLKTDALLAQMHIITSEGRVVAGAAAFRYLTRRLRRLWWLMPLLHIPFSLPFWQWGYDVIAKHRRRCTTERCDLS